MTSTDLKPGDFVRHPEKGRGIIDRTLAQQLGVYYMRDGGSFAWTSDFTGWERVETVRPGHVQVRVDDLDLRSWAVLGEDHYSSAAFRAGVRVAKAVTAQRAESAPPAEEQERDEKPTSTTVTLYCPDCGEPITNTAMVEVNREGERYLDFCNVNVHTCPPEQPDEPTEFGARVTVTLPDGTREKWCRLGKHHPAPWLGETYDVPGEEWRLLCGRGTVTLGWDE